MSLLGAATSLSVLLLGVALLGVGWRLLRGPSLADRVVATDMLGLVGLTLAALFAAIAGHQGYLDIAFGIAVFGFLAAVAFAGLLERGGTTEDSSE